MKKNLLILVPVLLICITLLVAQSNEPITKSLQRSYVDSGINLEIDLLLSNFRHTLLEKGTLSKSELNDPSSIYAKLSAIENDVKPNDLGIKSFISKQPLNSILENNNILSASIQDQADIALFTYYQLFSAKYCEFTLYLQDKRLVEFAGEDLPINSFEAVLFEAISARKDQNVTTKNAKIIIQGDPLTPTEFVNFITNKLREMNLRPVTFQKR